MQTMFHGHMEIQLPFLVLVWQPSKGFLRQAPSVFIPFAGQLTMVLGCQENLDLDTVASRGLLPASAMQTSHFFKVWTLA